MCDALPPHSRPRPILPVVAKRVWFGDDIPPHATLASPVWDPGRSPSLAQPGRDEGRRQGMLSQRPHLPGRAVRRQRRGLRPAVLGGTTADRSDPAHPAPA